MPIAAQCGSCAARYKIVESAAGRRVRCRRCGTAFVVPGGAPAEAGLDLRALADLERRGQVMASTPEAELEQYKSALATLAPPENKRKGKAEGRSIHDLATPEYRKKMGEPQTKKRPKNSAAGMVQSGAIIVAAVLLLGAVGLSATAFIVPSMIGISWLYLWLVTMVGFVWLTVIAFMDHWGHGVCVMLVPFYAFYYAFTHLDDGAGWPFGLAFGSRLMSYLLTFATITAMAKGEDPGDGPPGRLNTIGEVSSSGPGLPGFGPHRGDVNQTHEEHKYIIGVKAGAEAGLRPPKGWDDDFVKWLTDGATSKGFIVDHNDHGHYTPTVWLLGHVGNFGTHDVTYNESNGTYTPDPQGNGKVRVKIQQMHVQIMLQAEGGFSTFNKEKDLPEDVGTFTLPPGEDLQTYVTKKRWDDAKKALQELGLPDKDAWE